MDNTAAIVLLLITLSPAVFILLDDREWDRAKPKDKDGQTPEETSQPPKDE